MSASVCERVCVGVFHTLSMGVGVWVCGCMCEYMRVLAYSIHCTMYIVHCTVYMYVWVGVGIWWCMGGPGGCGGG